MSFSCNPIHTTENLIAKNTTKSISIYVLVVLVLIGLIISLPIIKIDISSQSRGIVRGLQENIQLNTIVSGKIMLCNLKNNQVVTVGDTLLVINRENLHSQQKLNDTLYSSNRLYLKDITNLTKGNHNTFKTTLGLETYNAFAVQLQELQQRINQAETNYNRYKKLYNKAVIAKTEMETHTNKLVIARQAKSSFIKQQYSKWEVLKRELNERIKSIESTLDNLENEAEKYVLTAPVSGTIENVLGLQTGSFVNATQTIATISPNANLIVENTVSPNDIGLLKIGQKVQFQLDAFNYNQWGMVSGKVLDIDKNITVQKNISFFKVRCSLDTKQIGLKNGYTTTISKGMTLTTRYFITRRSLFDLLFDKVDDWINPKIIDTN